jgi:predicted esterase
MHPHAGQPVAEAGVPLGQARTVVIMVHGRNAGPANILDLVPRLARADVTYLAPAAANRTWYPYSFMAEIAQNEPGLSSALKMLAGLVDRIEQAGIPRARTVVLGFSQGACLASEFMVRHAARYGGLIAFTGGLVGPPGTRWTYPGGFDGTPMFLGSGDPDAHVPVERVTESAGVFTHMGATVTRRIYPGMGHLVSEDEIVMAQTMLDAVARS